MLGDVEGQRMEGREQEYIYTRVGDPAGKKVCNRFVSGSEEVDSEDLFFSRLYLLLLLKTI